jgi:hypothetical protein
VPTAIACRYQVSLEISLDHKLARRSLQKNRLIALERAAAADAEYEFADGSSSPANAIIVGVGVGPDASLPRSIRVALRFTPRRIDHVEIDAADQNPATFGDIDRNQKGLNGQSKQMFR